MILKTNGKAYTIDGRTYIVGSEIAAVSESPYYGLIGTITEIRTGKDKETNNRTADIYCSFDIPESKEEIRLLEKHFSDLFGEQKTIDDIALDLVIMAPEEIRRLAANE